MKNISLSNWLCFLALVLPGASNANEKSTYINYSPDTRYSDDDGRTFLVVNFSTKLYSYGHNFGAVGTCDSGSDGGNCVSLGFIELLKLADGCRVGELQQKGQTVFTTKNIEKVMILGQTIDGCRVEVTKNSELVNSYLYSPERGVVSISLPAFGSEYVKCLTFFLKESHGIFGRNPKPGPD